MIGERFNNYSALRDTFKIRYSNKKKNKIDYLYEKYVVLQNEKFFRGFLLRSLPIWLYIVYTHNIMISYESLKNP